MGIAILYMTLAYVYLSIFNRPWVAVLAYYLYVLINPQHIWFWIFTDLPISKILSIAILLGLIIRIIRGKVNFQNIKHRQNYALLLFWMLIHLSNHFSPFPNFKPGVPVELVLSTLNSILIIYFSSQLLLTERKHLKYLFYVLLITGVYYTYWSNMSYITGEIWIYSTTGRLRGPFGSVYSDENALGLILTIGLPFILFYALSFKSKLYMLCLLAVIPLLWHAIFLTGSRGALVGMIVSLLFSLYLIKSKSLNIVIVTGFIFAMLLQGGAMLNRTESTIDRSQFDEDEAIDPRVHSWEAGLKMMLDYPLLGVGTEKFQAAYPLYMEGKIHVAHNTFFQIGANNGPFAGFLYLYIFYSAFKSFRKLQSQIGDDPELHLLNNATMAGMIAFFVTSMFLDLMIFECLYYLLLLNVVKERLIQNILNETPHPEEEVILPRKTNRRLSIK